MTPHLRYRFTVPMSVLWRPGGSLQVGLDAAGAVLLPAAPDGADLALRALRVPRTLGEIARIVPGVPGGWIAEAVAALCAAGVVRDVTAAAPVSIVVRGDGALAHAVTGLLTSEGRSVIAQSGPQHHDAAPESLVIVCPDTAEPDRVDARELAVSGLAHLIVRAEPERTVVGPFVTPGGGHACLTCTDLVRRDLDRAWPHLLAQLCRSQHTATPQQAAWASALASAQVTAWLAGRTPEASGITWELDAHTGQVGVRRWPRHPDCGCALTG